MIQVYCAGQQASLQQDEAYYIYKDFKEILQSEVYVDLERLRILARHGIPNELRGEVWAFLLGVEEADRSKELSRSKARNEEYEQMDKEDSEIAKKIRNEVSRFQTRTPELAKKEYTEIFERIIIAYLNSNRDIEYNASMIHLCAPFIYTMTSEFDAYFCFERLMQAITDEYDSMKERVSNFMTLFRYVIPDLCNYFEDEEVNVNEFASVWLQNLLSKEMKFENLLRLLDSYFSMNDPLEFHPFVCLGILKHLRDYLEELEHSEIRAVLLRLPELDMRRVLAEAQNIQHETMERQLYEEGELS